MKRVIVAVALLCAQAGFALDFSASGQDAEYWKVVSGRAQKIVDKIEIDDPAKSARVRDIIAAQYSSLRDIHDGRDAEVKAVKDGPSGATSELKAKIELIETRADLRVRELHYHFLAQLAVELSSDQIVQVKDGMTYGVVPITYHRYTQLLPDLGEEHMRYIYSALVEAREFAMDEGSSDEKHKRFGKYKGRINNYLSKLGINMKEAEQALAEKEKKSK